MEFQVALSAALAEFGTPTAAPGVTRIVSAFLTELQVELVSDTTDGAADGTAHSDRAHWHTSVSLHPTARECSSPPLFADPC
jgi:hypothetical protein